MDTLDGSEWDVVISGTGLVPSLLALSLSRSGKRILHLDENGYYGGSEAALSLSEAEAWVSRFSHDDSGAAFSHASTTKPTTSSAEEKSKLSPPRAYSLALAPHLIYARSNLIDALVTSQAHNQLDFQAVGSWFIADTSTSHTRLIRVPSGREDVFQDTSFDLKSKRSLMKFLRFVASYEEHGEIGVDGKDLPFTTFLEQKFALPPASHGPIIALTLLCEAPNSISTKTALPRIARYLRSIGVFGPGFGAVLPKWGGLAEIAQVACRACAVGGGVYVLNKSIKNIERKAESSRSTLELVDGEKVSTTWLCGHQGDLPRLIRTPHIEEASNSVSSRSISIISSPLRSLFPSTSEDGVTPAGAVIVVPSPGESEPPVHLFVHTSDAGECPMNQSVVYASIALPQDRGLRRLKQAVEVLLRSIDEQSTPEVLWAMRFQQRCPQPPQELLKNGDGIIEIPCLFDDLALDDGMLQSVKSAWELIMGESETAFMHFEARGAMQDDDTLD